MGPDTLAPLIPIAAILVWGAIKMANILTKGRAAADPAATARLEAMEAELGALRQELGEVHERLDFTERLLARQTPTRLDPPG